MRKYLIILFLLISPLLQGATYYVATGGNDAAAGTVAAPWAHHPWMSTWTEVPKVLNAGDIVRFKCGDTWTIATPAAAYMTVAQSGSTGSHIKTATYGAGALPVINISTGTNFPVIYADAKSYLIFDSLNITHHNSAFNSSTLRSGIYLDGITNPCHDIIIRDCEIENIPFYGIHAAVNGYNIVVGDTTKTATATTLLYSNNIHDFGYSGVTLQGSDPGTDLSNFKVYYNYIHDNTRTGVGENAYGIVFTASNNPSNSWPNYAYARYNRVEDIPTWEGIDTHGGTYLYFQYNYIKNCGNQGVAVQATNAVGYPAQTLNHVYIDSDTIEQTEGSWVVGNEDSFIHVSGVTTPLNNEIYIRDNVLFYTARPTAGALSGIRIGNLDGVTISGNQIYNGETTTGSSAVFLNTDGGSGGLKNITITKNYIYEWGPAIELVGAAIKGTIAITNNIVAKSQGNAALYLSDTDITSTGVVTVYNNIFMNSTTGTYILSLTKGIDAGGSFTFKNNIVGRLNAATTYYIYWQGPIDGTFICDYNQYWNSTAGYFDYLGSARNWTAWKALGFDAHSPNITGSLDPVFTNAGGSYALASDFTLQVTSPAIAAGVGVGLVTDYAGDYWKVIPSIGAYEYDSDPPTPPPTPPEITTDMVYYWSTGAKVSGTTIDDGGGTITAKGICYSTSANPTTADSKISGGTGTDDFWVRIIDLAKNTTYHVRAYVTNAEATTYGEDIEFTTPAKSYSHGSSGKLVKGNAGNYVID